MAALYGRMKGARGMVTRTGTAGSGIWSELETWEGSVVTELDANGDFRVFIGPKSNARDLVVEGNIDTREARFPTINVEAEYEALQQAGEVGIPAESFVAELEEDHADGCDCPECFRRVNGYYPRDSWTLALVPAGETPRGSRNIPTRGAAPECGGLETEASESHTAALIDNRST